MIKGVSHICFVVADLARSTEFFCDKLGLRFAFDFKDADGKVFGAYLHAGERTFIELFKGTPSAASDDASFRHICLEVDDIAETARGLKESGIEVSEPELGSDGSMQAWLKDPEGNPIELHQFLPGSFQANALAAKGD
ncbi:MAG: VOC family protein [Phycisphaerae bacterium]|nr:VOC family protein [Phycisphaerae bacterium]